MHFNTYNQNITKLNNKLFSVNQIAFYIVAVCSLILIVFNLLALSILFLITSLIIIFYINYSHVIDFQKNTEFCNSNSQKFFFLHLCGYKMRLITENEAIMNKILHVDYINYAITVEYKQKRIKLPMEAYFFIYKVIKT